MIAVWLMTRVIALTGLTVSGGSILVDIRMYEAWSQIIAFGSAPTGDPTWQYPPVLMFPIWLAQIGPMHYQQMFVLLALAADLLLLIILMRILRASGGSTLGVWVWASAGLWIGPIVLARLDVFTALPAVVALALIARPVLSGSFAALGALMKVWPGLLLIALPRKHLLHGLIGFAITAAALVLLSVLMMRNPWSFLENQQGRGLNGESMAAVPYILANSLGAEVNFEYRFGSNEVANASADSAAVIIAAFGIGLLLLLLAVRLLGGFERALPGDVALMVVLTSVLVSRVFSPQYFIWLGALASFALLFQASKMKVPAALIVLAALMTQPLYPWFPGAIYTAEPWAVALHALRMVLLVAALICGLFVTVDMRQLLRALRKPLTIRE